MTPSQSELRAARKALGLTCQAAAELVGVTLITWQRWEGQTSRKTEPPRAAAELFRILNEKQTEE
jgi:DNA-binding transcriptional regulator YiaG